jgi:hypothetical protein
VRGKASLYDVELLRLPADFLVTQGDAAELDPTTRTIDPDGTLEDATHILPFGGDIMDVMEKSIDAGATVFIGSLKNYPGNSFKLLRSLRRPGAPHPGVWVSGTDGAWLREQLAAGPVKIKLAVASTLEDYESHNVVGELPGADDEVVMIGSHHDGPWSSAVEDGSGISLVLAQATYWAAQPADKRPHKMVFLLHGGHMSDGAGLHQYIEAHREELAKVVLEIHLEHAAPRVRRGRGRRAEVARHAHAKWWFVSRLPELEASVKDALEDRGHPAVDDPGAQRVRRPAAHRRRVLPHRGRPDRPAPGRSVVPVRRAGPARQDRSGGPGPADPGHHPDRRIDPRHQRRGHAPGLIFLTM